MSYINSLAAAQRHIRDLRLAFAGVVLLACAAMYFVYTSPRHLDLHVAPNPRAGDVVSVRDGVSPVPNVNVYGFAYYLWQQVNRWHTDGAKDYGQQIFTWQHYITPSCQEQLKADMDRRSKAGELSTRTRSLNEIPGQAFSTSRVLAESDNAWTVLLDMQLTETVRGVPVKDTYLRYPMRVVRFDVDRQKNPWGLAIDCFGGSRPERLDPAVVASGQQTPAPLAATPTPLPSTQPVSHNQPAEAQGNVPVAQR